MDCSSGKNCYETESEALASAKYQEKTRGVVLGVYLCDCGAWHLTSVKQ